MSCTHTIERSEYVQEEHPFTGEVVGEWRYWTEDTVRDIDTGRYCCTQCGEVMYYTGRWREHWEGGRKLLDERTGDTRATPKENDQ